MPERAGSQTDLDIDWLVLSWKMTPHLVCKYDMKSTHHHHYRHTHTQSTHVCIYTRRNIFFFLKKGRKVNLNNLKKMFLPSFKSHDFAGQPFHSAASAYFQELSWRLSWGFLPHSPAADYCSSLLPSFPASTSLRSLDGRLCVFALQ